MSFLSRQQMARPNYLGLGALIAGLTILAMGGAVGAYASATPALTGLVEFGTSSNGTYVTDDWNTIGGDVAFNLYIAQGGSAGAFLNSGDGPSTSIQIPLSPGTYAFTMFGEGPANPVSYYGLNLFFGGSTTSPSISVFAPAATTTTPPVYSADGQGTPFLGPFTSYTATIVGGAGTTSVLDGGESISLTSYSWANPSVYGLDRVGPYSSNPDGSNDYVGQFTLNVTEVPEAGALPVLMAGGLGLFFRHQRAGARARQ